VRTEGVRSPIPHARGPRPGSLPWLLGKQLRWQWQALTGGQRTGLYIALAVLVLAVVGGYFALRSVLAGLPLNAPLPDVALGPVLLAQAFLLTLMLSAAVRAALVTLFTRSDLDLLLHSPLPPRVVLASRALGVALSAALPAGLLVVPLTLALLVLGVWRGGLGLLLWWLCASLLASSAGLWLTLGLVRVLGVRRTRTVSAVLGALFGAGLFLASQWVNLSGGRGRSSNAVVGALASFAPGQGGWPGREAWLWLPARAVWLEPLPALLLLGLSMVVFAVTVPALTRQFVNGAQEIAAVEGPVRPSRLRMGRLRFASGSRATLLKEWRLIWRDPELLSRTLLQVVYLLPLLFSVTRGGGLRAAGGTGVVLLTASLTAALAHLTLNAEDAPDLLVSAPRSPAALRRDKWLAAVIPTVLIGLVALTVLALRGALGTAHWLSLIPLLLMGTGGTALMVLWQPLPVRRSDAFKRSQRAPLVNTVLTLVFQGGLSATAYAASCGALWGLATLAVALIALGVAYSLRRSDVR
jgi:ABC-2 type transport system permease protein